MSDNVYVDARKLNSLLYHMSITFDLYMGVSRVGAGGLDGSAGAGVGAGAGAGDAPPASDDNAGDESNDDSDAAGLSDRSYCALEAGILLSSSVIRKMRNNLERCVRIGITSDHSVNIGRCVKYASHVSGCQDTFQVSYQRFGEVFINLIIENCTQNATSITLMHINKRNNLYQLYTN